MHANAACFTEADLDRCIRNVRFREHGDVSIRTMSFGELSEEDVVGPRFEFFEEMGPKPPHATYQETGPNGMEGPEETEA